MSVLLPLWFALLAADRVDLLAGRGPFVLTPFLVLTPVIVLVAWRHRLQHGEPLPLAPLRLAPFRLAPLGLAPLRLAVLLLALVIPVIGSVFVSMDVPRSAMRAVQLVAVAFGVAAVRLAVPPSALRAGLVRGARWGVRLYAFACLGQLLVLAGVIPAALPLEELPIVSLAPSLHGGLLPRLSGFVVDSNRSGLVLLVYAALLWWDDWRRHVGTLATALFCTLLTLSRSSMLAGLAALAWELWSRSRRAGQNQPGVSARPRALYGVGVAAAVTTAVVSALLLVSPRLRAESARVVAPVAERFSFEEGSGDDHLRLLARGIETGTRSVPTALHGIGYGSAYLELQDFFPGDRYGNFHSVYVGIFAESGVFALIVTVLLIGVPLLQRTRQAALSAAVAVFGVFYGALAEPTFWFAITVAWLPLVMSARPKATSNPTATPRMAPSTS